MNYCILCTKDPKSKFKGSKIVCKSCQDPTITIRGPQDVTKKVGLLQSEMSKIVFGYSNGPSIHKYYKNDRYYSIKSIISTAEKLFKNDPKRMNKLEKFKKNLQLEIDHKSEISKRKESILNNVEVNIEKISTVFDFNNDDIKAIISDGFLDLSLTDEQIVHKITSELEEYNYYIERKINLDKLIDKHIHENYREKIKSTLEYDDYINMFYKNDDHLMEIYDILYQKYKKLEGIDNRQLAIFEYINSITNDMNPTETLRKVDDVKKIYDPYVLDNSGNFDDTCNNIYNVINPINEKYKQVCILKNELDKWNINLSISLNKNVEKLTSASTSAKRTLIKSAPKYIPKAIKKT